MKSSEKRIAELEQRVAHLESLVKGFETSFETRFETERPKSIHDPIQNTVQNQVQKPVIPGNPAAAVKVNKEEKRQPIIQKNQPKDREALVGKYIIGALATVLIFVAAISFIGLVWNRMTPEIKLSIIALAGTALSSLGFWLIRTKKNPITSIILGTGAGLLFIAILSANLAFHLIGNNMSILLAGIWAVLFMISSRYTNLFFTTIIAYIGSYITLMLGLVLMQGDTELLLLFVFVSCISGVMIYTALNKGKTELITALILSMVSYTAILLRCYADGFFGSGYLLNGYAVQIALIFIIYVLMNLLYKVINNTKAVPVYLIVSAVTTLLTVLFIGYLNSAYLDLRTITCYMLFFTIHFIQFILNQVYYKRMERALTRYYTVILVFTSLFINIELYEVPTGIILIGLLLIASEKIWKGESKLFLIGAISLLDSIFLLSNYSDSLISSVYGLIQLGVMGYVLWKCVDSKQYARINGLKIMGMIVVLANSFGIPSNLINRLNLPGTSMYTDNVTGYFIAVIATIVLLRYGYFKNWKNEQFRFFGKNDGLEEDKGMQVLSYVVSTVLYLYGLLEMGDADRVYLKLMAALAVIAIALVQSKLLLSGSGRNSLLTGIWIVFKYLMLTWTVLWSFFDLNITSASYSIIGLMVAIGSISAGFKLRNRSIRLYGLVLTIIMVAKFIVVDLNGENSITRVLALIAGGGMCFLISLIYNKLSENYS
ncbi:DUF2339 domain-containing protein [Lacrimispora sp.]|uniref:DUF2339 domain-containing protein n=1 Tax=Lacrimispora sp. TaxID=2719234 RepID=UPI002FDA4C76